MRSAIFTKYAGPTNTKGSRIIARCGERRIVRPYHSALSSLENHWAAASILCPFSTFAEAESDDGYVFIPIDTAPIDSIKM